VSPGKIKVLHLIKSLGRGGAEMLLPETIRLHDKEKFEFHCIYFLPWKSQMVDALVQQGARVTCIGANNNLEILRQIPAIIRYIQEHKIDLIHSHLPWAGFASRIIHRRTKVPVVYTEHNKQERYHKITKLLNRKSFNWQSQVIAVSSDVAESIKSNIACTVPVTTVLNGVNTVLFQRNMQQGIQLRKQHGISEDAIVVGNLAVFRFQKRLPEWLDAIHAIYNNNPTIRAVLVGAGPLEQEVKAKIESLQLQEVVITPGLQTNTVDWFSMMDIFMMSSEFEGLPIALLEAMSCECAVVSTDAGGIKEVIRHEKDGLLVGVDEWGQLAQEVQKLIVDNDLLGKLKIAARERVVHDFSLQKMVDQLESIYFNLISPGKGSAVQQSQPSLSLEN
jgi:glycosyltransferase involved in cell wall biosynthesis